MYMIETMIFNGLILILIMFSISSVKQNNIPWIESVNSYRGLMALLIVSVNCCWSCKQYDGGGHHMI